jgi:hypothetical protein
LDREREHTTLLAAGGGASEALTCYFFVRVFSIILLFIIAGKAIPYSMVSEDFSGTFCPKKLI